MIQFNLLPDVKLEFVKVTRTKRIVTLISLLCAAVVFIIFLLLFAFNGLQRKNLNDINNDIATTTTQLKATPDLEKILTVQNQLQSLPAIEKSTPVASRMSGYISQITPSGVTVSSLSVDFTAHSFKVSGDAASLDLVNTYVDTLKFTTYSSKTIKAKKAFSGVVLASFTKGVGKASFGINLNFDPNLFMSESDVKLTVPSIVSTRSQSNQPTAIFQQSTTKTGN